MSDEIVIEDAEEIEAEVEHLPAVHVSASPANLFGAATPEAVLEQATAQAKVLKDVIRQQKLSTVIQGREHVSVEGWTTLGSMLGVFPVVEWTRELGDDEGWEARVVATTLSGQVVGAAEAMCSRSESTWRKRESYALRSMAQTRATSKALRLPLGFVMQLAGYSPTPVEEMDYAGSDSGSRPEQSVTHFDRSLGIRRMGRGPNGDWPKVCPYCTSAVEQKSGTNRNGKPYQMWKCRSRDCVGGEAKRDGGFWPWSSFHDDPWQAGGEIDELVDEETAPRDDAGGFDPKAAMHQALAGLTKWDDEMKRKWVVSTMDSHGMKAPLTEAQVLEVAAFIANEYYIEFPDEKPWQ